MFPHPDTVCVMSTLDYQERLQEAAKERIAASAQAGGRSPLTRAQATFLAAASWLGRVPLRLLGAKRVSAPSLAGAQTRTAGHVS